MQIKALIWDLSLKKYFTKGWEKAEFKANNLFVGMLNTYSIQYPLSFLYARNAPTSSI